MPELEIMKSKYLRVQKQQGPPPKETDRKPGEKPRPQAT